MANGLTTRQQKFVALVREGKTPRDAAEGAGFAPGSALVQSQRLLRHPLVKAALEEQQGQPKSINGYDAAEAMQALDELSGLCTKAFTLAAELRDKLGSLLDRNASMAGGSLTINIIGLAPPGAVAPDPSASPNPAPAAIS